MNLVQYNKLPAAHIVISPQTRFHASLLGDLRTNRQPLLRNGGDLVEVRSKQLGLEVNPNQRKCTMNGKHDGLFTPSMKFDLSSFSFVELHGMV